MPEEINTTSTEKARELTDHQIDPSASYWQRLDIAVLDKPGHGNACHRYVIFHPNDDFNQELNSSMAQYINFQDGPIKEFGINGVTQETLLTIVIDRLRGFQSGDFACRENAIALTHIETALMWLQNRTRKRLARGVEGTNTK